MSSFPIEGNQTFSEPPFYKGAPEQIIDTDYSLFIDLFFVLNFVSFIIFQHTHFQIRRAFKRNSQPANLWLLFHIGVSLFEVIQYHIRTALKPNLQIGRADFGLTMIQSISSLALYIAREQAGYKDAMHISFRIQPLLARPVATLLSMLHGNTSYHDISLRISSHSFIYTRLIIFAARKIRLSASHKELYNSAALLGTMLAVHDSKVNKFAAHAYLLATFASMYIYNRVDATAFKKSSRRSATRIANRLQKFTRVRSNTTRTRSNTTRPRSNTTTSRFNTTRVRSNTIASRSNSKYTCQN